MTHISRGSNSFGGLLPYRAALVASVVFIIVGAFTWPLTSDCHPDLGLYRRAAENIASGKLPYRDFRFEYPPLAVLPCVLPVAISQPFVMAFESGEKSASRFRWGFLLVNTIFLFVIVWSIARIQSETLAVDSRSGWAIAIGAGILAPFLAWRYDVFPAMLTALAFLASTQARPILTGGLIGLAISAKLYPIVLLPVLFLWFAKITGVRSGFALVLSCFAALGLTILPFVPEGLDGLFRMLTFHNERGVHVESLSGGVILLSNLLAGETTPLGVSYGAWHIHSAVSDSLASLHGFFFLSMYGIFLLITRLRIWTASIRDRVVALPLLMFGALLVFIVSNKVLSPQYLAWLLPFVAFLRPFQIILFLVSCVASILIFPVGYDALLHEEPWAVLLLNFRNGVLLLLILTVLYDLSVSKIAEQPEKNDGMDGKQAH